MMMRLFPEMEVWGYGVLEEVDEEISAEYEEGCTAPAQFDAGRNHFDDGGGEHESGAQRHEILEVTLFPITLNEDESAKNVGKSGGQAESQAEESDVQLVLSSEGSVLRSPFSVLRSTAE